MKIADIAASLEAIAPLVLQEAYDNAGLLTGSPQWECTGVLCTLDVTEAVVEEAVSKHCNCIVAHHPVVFKPLRSLTGQNHVERVLIRAIKNDIAIYAAHTNLDNIVSGVNGKIADALGLTNRSVLASGKGELKKLYTYVPKDHLEEVREALFRAGAGHIGNYSECSFTSHGTGTFKPGAGTHPFSGKQDERQEEAEIRLELIMPGHLEKQVLAALLEAHPYEEVAYDVVLLANRHAGTGSGLVGEFPEQQEGKEFLGTLNSVFRTKTIRHSRITGRPVKKVAVCGGAGSFLIPHAIASGADAFVTADLKYHEFFDAEGFLLLCDIGHYESEQFTIDLFVELLLQKFPTFAVLKSGIITNPVCYFPGK